MKEQALITKLKSPFGFAVGWPFVAWAIFSIIGMRIFGGQTLMPDTPAEPDIIGGFSFGEFGFAVVFCAQFLPGALAMMLIKREFISNIFGLAAYAIYSVFIFIVFIFVLHGKIPNVFIFIDM